MRSTREAQTPRESPALSAIVGSAALLVLVLFALVSVLAGTDQRRVAVLAPGGGATYTEGPDQPARCVVDLDTDAPVLHARLDWCIDPVDYPLR